MSEFKRESRKETEKEGRKKTRNGRSVRPEEEKFVTNAGRIEYWREKQYWNAEEDVATESNGK